LKTRVGFGFDIHPLKKGRKLVLGGAEIPHSSGLAGWSDGDALVHAIIDALLGAMAEADIGQLFPAGDPRLKGLRSTILLEEVMKRLAEKRARIVIVDSVIAAESPRLAPYIKRMKAALCPILGVAEDDLGIKAKTHEGIGAFGRGEAVACWAVALVEVGRAARKKSPRSTRAGN